MIGLTDTKDADTTPVEEAVELGELADWIIKCHHNTDLRSKVQTLDAQYRTAHDIKGRYYPHHPTLSRLVDAVKAAGLAKSEVEALAKALGIIADRKCLWAKADAEDQAESKVA